MALRVVSVEEYRHWRADSPEIAVLEVGSDAIAEPIGAPLARGIERGLGTWKGWGSVLPSGGDAELIRYRQSPRPRVRPSHWPLGRCECRDCGSTSSSQIAIVMRCVGGS